MTYVRLARELVDVLVWDGLLNANMARYPHVEEPNNTACRACIRLRRQTVVAEVEVESREVERCSSTHISRATKKVAT